MSADGFAYQASSVLAAAIIARCEEIADFNRTTVAEANKRLHPNEPLWAGSAFDPQTDRRCVGFNDGAPDEPVPKGLSRAKTRVELRPARGKAGAAWQDEMDTLNERPVLEPVFREFGVEFAVMGTAAVHRPAMRIDDTAGEVWFFYRIAPRSCDHLAPRKLSDYYAFTERMDAQEPPAAAEATS